MIYLFNIYQAEDKEFEAFFSESLSDWFNFDPEITAQQTEKIIGFNPSKQMKCDFEVCHPGAKSRSAFLADSALKELAR